MPTLLLWLLPGGFIVWLLGKMSGEKAAREDHLLNGLNGGARGGALPPSPLFSKRGLRSLSGLDRPGPQASWATGPMGAPIGRRMTTGDYLRHLREATDAARMLDLVKPLALAGDVQGLMASPVSGGVADALHALSAPLDVLCAQKDLNVLGASPPLPEDGIMGQGTRAAVAAIQARFGQVPTGTIDASTAVAIRYSVGCINAQGM
jgi:hypothetical protein